MFRSAGGGKKMENILELTKYQKAATRKNTGNKKKLDSSISLSLPGLREGRPSQGGQHHKAASGGHMDTVELHRWLLLSPRCWASEARPTLTAGFSWLSFLWCLMSCPVSRRCLELCSFPGEKLLHERCSTLLHVCSPSSRE